VHLIGPTKAVPLEPFAERPFVVRVVRVSEKYRLLGRHHGQVEALGFEYRGLRFGQDTLHVFPGLCAVDNRENVDRTFAAIAAAGVKTARMGAYKPRTSPTIFRGSAVSACRTCSSSPASTASKSWPWRSHASATSTKSATR